MQQDFKLQPLTIEYLDNANILQEKIFKGLTKDDKLSFNASLNKSMFHKWYKKNEVKDLNYWIMLNTKTDEIVGIIGLYFQTDDAPNICWLGWFGVNEKYRRYKLGSTMLDFIINKAKSHNCNELHLYTYDSKDYIPAIKMYEKYGFKLYDTYGKTIFLKLTCIDKLANVLYH